MEMSVKKYSHDYVTLKKKTFARVSYATWTFTKPKRIMVMLIRNIMLTVAMTKMTVKTVCSYLTSHIQSFDVRSDFSKLFNFFFEDG